MKHQVFSPETLDRLTRETLPADAKPGEKVVVGTVDDKGVQVVAAFKFKPWLEGTELRWELQAAYRHEWTGDDAVGGKVLLRWE